MKRLDARKLSGNQLILRFDVILQHDWPIEQCLLHIRVFFGGKTKSQCFDLSIHWPIKQISNTFRNHFSRSYENRSNAMYVVVRFYNVSFSFFDTKFYKRIIMDEPWNDLMKPQHVSEYAAEHVHRA